MPSIRRLLAIVALALLPTFPLNTSANVVFSTTNTVWKFLKGRSEASSPDITAWRQPAFDDSAWASAPAPFYYSDTPTEPPFYYGGPVTGTVLSDMLSSYTCIFMRKTFLVANAANAGAVTVQVAADDGFIIWLNGVEVARTNMPAGQIPFGGAAIASLTEPYPIYSFVLSNGASWLREGTNVLAFQPFNWVSNSSDFGAMAGLSLAQDATPPIVSSIDPEPGTTVLQLMSIRTMFDEPITNVNASDLLVNNQPATGLTIISNFDCLFTFPRPATGTVTVAWAPGQNIRDRSGNSFAGGGWIYQFDSNATASAIITEFMAENDGSLLDEDGENSDWVEIYNPGPLPLDLDDWCLTDDSNRLTKWRFPSTNLAAKAYLVVFASGKDRRVAGARLHTNFRLDADGGYLALVKSDGVTIASDFAPTYPKQRANISYGRRTSDSLLVYFPTSTPGSTNGLGVLGFVADTTFSVNRGFFFGPTNVTISSATPGATLVYTLNGTEPALTNGTVVNATNALAQPFVTLPITNTMLLRAAAFKTDYLATDVDTHTYIFPQRVTTQTRPGWLPATWPGGYPADFDVDSRVVYGALPGYSFTNALVGIPTVSIVTASNDLFSASTGIYANSTQEGPAWEKRAAMELIYPDGRGGFHINCGVRMHGYSSRDNGLTPKHSFSLLFRGEFGPTKLNYPVFTNSSVQSFDQLILRGCSTDSWPVIEDPAGGGDPYPRWTEAEASYMRDQWMRDASGALGMPASHGVYVHLYLDGFYWGLYNLSERPDDSFAAAYLGGDKSEYDVVADGGVLHAGNLNAWNSLMAAAQAGFANDAAYQQVQGNNLDGTRNTNFPVLIHLTNLIDCMILHIQSGAVDWPHHNWWAARRQGPKSEGFQFFVWDQEISNNSLTRQHVDSVNIGNPLFAEVNAPNSPAAVYAAMRQNAEFRQAFADRVHKHLFNNGALTPATNIARWQTRHNEIDKAMVGESARWGDYRRPAVPYKREVEWLTNQNWMVNTYWPSNLALAIKRFRDAGLYPQLGAPGFSQFGGAVPVGYQLSMTHTNVGGIIYFTLDGSDPRLRGGAIAPNATAYTQSVSLASPTLVRARVRSGTTWSALVEARFTTPQDFGKLLISEIHYNPPMFAGVDGDEMEFLELQNTGSVALDLGGLNFSGITFTFTNETLLDPGAFFVLVRNPTRFAARFPGAPWNGVYGGKLDNGGEMVAISAPSGGTVLSVTYDDAPPWPLDADGSGLSLQRVNAAPDANAANNWIAATPTPGAALPAALVDTDGDGMPDLWEQAYQLNPAQAADANQDADGDGVTNLAEYRAGTDPKNAADYLRFTQAEAVMTQDRTVVVRFHAAANRSYSVLARDSVDPGCWTKIADLPAQANERDVAVTNTVPLSSATRFYRLVTPMGVTPCL